MNRLEMLLTYDLAIQILNEKGVKITSANVEKLRGEVANHVERALEDFKPEESK